eukprot:693058-Heterocapsa_arctica.AAC.1
MDLCSLNESKRETNSTQSCIQNCALHSVLIHVVRSGSGTCGRSAVSTSSCAAGAALPECADVSLEPADVGHIHA